MTTSSDVTARARHSRELRTALCKLGEMVHVGKAASPTPEAARTSLERLERLESAKPKPDEIARGALLGSIVGPAATLLQRAASGGGPINPGKRQLAATALNSAVLGSAMPLVSNKIEREAEKTKLRKLLVESQKTARAERGKAEGGNGAKMLTGLVGNLGTRASQRRLGEHVLRGAEREIASDPRRTRELLEAVERNAGDVPIVRTPHVRSAAFVPSQFASNAMRQQFGVEVPAGGVMLGVEHPSILAHELGHADLHRSRLGRIIQNPATMALGGTARASGVLSGIVSGALTDDPKLQAAAVAAPAALALPQLAYEAGASVLGARRLRRAGAAPAQMRAALKLLGPAWGSYAMNALGGSANALLAQGIVSGLRGKKQHSAEAPPR